MNLKAYRTDQLIALLRGLAIRRQRQLAAVRPAWVRLGDGGGFVDRASAMMKHAADTAASTAQVGMRAALDTAGTPFAWAYGNLSSGAQQLYGAAKTLRDENCDFAARVADELGSRAKAFAEAWGDAATGLLRKAGEAAGDAYRGFFGFSPGMALIAGLVVLGGAGYLLLTPGGQALLTGGASAIGTGGGEVLVGGGKALGSLAKLV